MDRRILRPNPPSVRRNGWKVAQIYLARSPQRQAYEEEDEDEEEEEDITSLLSDLDGQMPQLDSGQPAGCPQRTGSHRHTHTENLSPVFPSKGEREGDNNNLDHD